MSILWGIPFEYKAVGSNYAFNAFRKANVTQLLGGEAFCGPSTQTNDVCVSMPFLASRPMSEEISRRR